MSALAPTSPHQRLEVAGLGVFTQVSITGDPGGGIGPVTLVGYNSTSDYGFVSAINTGVAGKNLSLQPIAGNVGIGTTSPRERLEVAGNLKLTGTGNITLTGAINAKYQDVAEWVPSSERILPGTVVILDSTKSNQVIYSTQAYDTRVAGVVSEKPGIALGERPRNDSQWRHDLRDRLSGVAQSDQGGVVAED